jgi:tripartite-type tricarboxylate transporter receptor subunit TctC
MLNEETSMPKAAGRFKQGGKRKMFKRMLLLPAAAVAAGALMVVGLAGAAKADYPTQPITLVAPYGAGGSSDLAARTLAGMIPEYLGQQVLVVNRTGAAGVTGSASVHTADPDGYTVLLARVGSQAVVPAMNPAIPYTWDDWTMLGLLSLDPFVCATGADSPYETLEDLTTAMKENPGTIRAANSGVGTMLDLINHMVLDTQGLDSEAALHVPFDGDGEVTAAVVGGHVDFTCINLAPILGQIQAGNVRALAVTTPDRVDEIPDTPTFTELGYPQMEAGLGWSGIYGPPDMDEAATKAWVDALAQVREDEEWRATVERLGSVPQILSPEDTREFVRQQYTTIRNLVERLDLEIN